MNEMSKPATILAAAAVLFLAGCSPSTADDAATLHERLLTLDTHLDTPLHFPREGWSFGERHTLADDLSQVDIPRMASGALDGGFFAIYTPQGPLTQEGYADALEFARTRSDVIDATIAKFPDRIEPALTAADAERIAAAGKLVAFKSMENSYPLGENLDLLEEFYGRGVRLAGPVHSSNNQFADSATDEPRWHGLSELGRKWVAEMNRLGMVIDASHSSDETFDQLLELSATPIILSHSGSSAAFEHPRSLDDARIRALADAGGAICVTSVFLSDMNLTDERAALFTRYEHIGELSPAEQAELTRQWRALDEHEQMWAANFEDYMDMLLHVIDVAGVDHVCFGADWDGGGGIDGLEDITDLPKITERLTAAGFTESDLAKMWSGNVLRILRTAQQHASE
ncbi:MAG TPA: membrane dipeptidase [Woeseiaceae bacterium]|nr:membrane dipeptidase [Woeseiaceae bacterium]